VVGKGGGRGGKEIFRFESGILRGGKRGGGKHAISHNLRGGKGERGAQGPAVRKKKKRGERKPTFSLKGTVTTATDKEKKKTSGFFLPPPHSIPQTKGWWKKGGEGVTRLSYGSIGGKITSRMASHFPLLFDYEGGRGRKIKTDSLFQEKKRRVLRAALNTLFREGRGEEKASSKEIKKKGKRILLQKTNSSSSQINAKGEKGESISV